MNVYRIVQKNKIVVPLVLVFLSFYLISGCGGGGSDTGDGVGTQTREVTGTIDNSTARLMSPGNNHEKSLFTILSNALGPRDARAVSDSGSFIIRATARNGSFHEIETNPMTGDFTIQLPVDECYTMSFFAHNGNEMMDEFWDNMAFDCGPDQIGEFDDQFCLSPDDSPLDLGLISVNSDHSFATPMHNPLQAVDNNGDGITDFNDPDYACGDVQDNNHDGYYDDDMNHDGFHDDDMDQDGFHDDDMNHDGFHDGGHMGGGGMGM